MFQSLHIGRIIWGITAACILFIGTLILTPFPDYIPPKLDRGFLANKGDFFWSSSYWLGFFAHITTAPLALLAGTLQFSRYQQKKWPGLHRKLGKAYVVLVLLGVAPGGLVMAMRSYGGISSQICFGALSVVIWIATILAWRNATKGQFVAHSRWMLRSYVLMCSAIVLRITFIAFNRMELIQTHELRYQVSAWLSWVAPWIILEASLARPRASRNRASLNR